MARDKSQRTIRQPASREIGLAEQLRLAIDRSGMSAGELARLAGIDPAQVLRFQRGIRDIRLETAGLLCPVLGLQLAEVSRGRGRPAVQKSQRVESPEED